MGNYNTYDFNSDTPFIPSKCCGDVTVDFDVDSLKDSIKESVNEGIDGTLEELTEKVEELTNKLNEQLSEKIDSTKDELAVQINTHTTNEAEGIKNTIEKSTYDIICEVQDSKTEICMCNIATKQDIKQAVSEINEHTDSKFDEIDFMSQFENLNNQIKNINNE